jgi:hypothetical protein
VVVVVEVVVVDVVEVVVVEVVVVEVVVVEELVVDAIFPWTVVVVCGTAIVVDGERVDVVDSGIVVVGTSNTVDDVVVVED